MIAARGFAAVLVIGLACTPTPTDEEDPMPNAAAPLPEPVPSVAAPAPAATGEGMSPRWRVGDEWDVRYMLLADKWEAWADATEEYYDVDWHYAVGHVADDGTVTVHATAPEWNPWRMVYAPSGRLLAVYERYDSWDHLRDEPFVPVIDYRSVDHPTKYWAKFPMRLGTERAEDGRWEQRVEERDGRLTVTFVGREDDEDRKVERIVVQEWEEGKPSWSAVNVSMRFIRDGVVTDKFELAGHVTAWRLSDDR